MTATAADHLDRRRSLFKPSLNWLVQGAQLTLVYTMIAIPFYFLPGATRRSRALPGSALHCT
jgi:hypothetical protein